MLVFHVTRALLKTVSTDQATVILMLYAYCTILVLTVLVKNGNFLNASGGFICILKFLIEKIVL